MTHTKTPDEVEAERQNLQRLYLSIGEFIFEFSQLEFMLRHALGEALGLNDDRFHTITSPYDFAALCRVTRSIYRTVPGCTTEECIELDELFKACLQINDERVRIAHGTWFISDEGLGTQHVSRSSLEPKIYYSRIEDINMRSSEVTKLKSRIVSFLIGPRSSWPSVARS